MGKGNGEDPTKGDSRLSASTVQRGVTVTVYVESSSPLIRSNLHNRKGKWRLNALTTAARSSDRRAELLAYSLKMRNSTSQDSIHSSDFRPKTIAKKWKWSLPLRKLRSAFGRVLRKDSREWRYERIETQGPHSTHQWCNPRSSTCNKAKRRMVRIFKKLWRGCCRWKCNKVRLHQ